MFRERTEAAGEVTLSSWIGQNGGTSNFDNTFAAYFLQLRLGNLDGVQIFFFPNLTCVLCLSMKPHTRLDGVRAVVKVLLRVKRRISGLELLIPRSTPQ